MSVSREGMKGGSKGIQGAYNANGPPSSGPQAGRIVADLAVAGNEVEVRHEVLGLQDDACSVHAGIDAL